MKYGIVTYNKRPMRKGSMNALNLGDPIQTYAMRCIYHHMKVPQDELIEISRYHAAEYDGEYVVLPFNCFNMIGNQAGHQYSTLPLSHKIIPVFISFHLHSRYIDDAILANLRSYQPIGCRDEETMTNLRKHGIVAYLSGCATALLPRRKTVPSAGKVFLVDVPESLSEYIPDKLKENAEYISHQPPFERMSEESYLTDTEYEKFYSCGINILERYRNEAALVVTSRLHAASPCMAMGIPVILAGNNFDGRFSWIDKYLHLYTPDEFHKIDWNPMPVEYEEEKGQLLEMFAGRIKQAYESNKDIYDASSFYENRNRANYNNRVLKFLNELDIKYQSGIRYALWGITDKTLTIKNMISDFFPSLVLSAVIDENVTGEFEGVKISKSADIESQDKDIIYFIVPKAAHKFGSEFLNKLGRRYEIIDF